MSESRKNWSDKKPQSSPDMRDFGTEQKQWPKGRGHEAK